MAWTKEDDAYFAKYAAARLALEFGRINEAIEWVISSGQYWRYKRAERISLVKRIYDQVGPITEETARSNPWQLELLAELYRIWPKAGIEGAILKHNFSEPHTDKTVVSGAEQVHLAKYSSGFLSERWGALSRGRFWLKFWDLETGEVICAHEEELPMVVSALGRDGSTVLFAGPWYDSKNDVMHWDNTFRQTFRRFDCGGHAYSASAPPEVRRYKVYGQVLRVNREQKIEVDRETFEKNPLNGEVLPAKDFWRHYSPRYQEWIRESRSEEEAEEVFREDKEEEEREKQIVRVRMPQTITLEHEAIDGYLPAGTTTFVAENWLGGPELDDLWFGKMSATVNVAGDEAWLTNIIAQGYGLKGMYNWMPTSPTTAVCISSDGAVAMKNGFDESFGMWNLWSGALLRKFEGHTGRVTCLNLSVDVSYAVSGSEDLTIRLWKPVTAECVRVLTGHEDVITQVCITFDATKIVSADRSGVIKVWDLNTGDCLRTIQAHSANVSGLHVMINGKFAASGSWDKTVKLWNLEDGVCLKTFEYEDWVTSVDMTPDGRYLATSSYAGTKLWELIWSLEPQEGVEWDESAQPYLEMIMNANAYWEGKLSTPIDMTEQEIKDTLRRGKPSWSAGHNPTAKDDWHKVWHLGWSFEETLGHAGYGWLSGANEAGNRYVEDWERTHSREETS